MNDVDIFNEQKEGQNCQSVLNKGQRSGRCGQKSAGDRY